MVAIKRRIMELVDSKTNNAIRLGNLDRGQECLLCGKQQDENSDKRRFIEAHHPDYRQPFFIIWLCYNCHQQHHSDLTAADFYTIGEIVKTYLLEKNRRKIEQTGLLRGINKRFSKICVDNPRNIE